MCNEIILFQSSSCPGVSATKTTPGVDITGAVASAVVDVVTTALPPLITPLCAMWCLHPAQVNYGHFETADHNHFIFVGGGSSYHSSSSPPRTGAVKRYLVVDDPVEQPPSKRAVKNQKYHKNNSALTKKLACLFLAID